MSVEPALNIEMDEATNFEPAAKILLIDLENCPNKIQQLQEDLKGYSKVVICYASTGAKIPLDWLMALNETINSNRLQIYKMESAGKNSADFGIFFFAGMLAQQLGQHADFTIVSDDTDLDHLVSLLNSQSHQAKRQGKEKAAKIQSKVAEQSIEQDVIAGVRLYCEYLAGPNASRPASVTSLKNSICSHMKQNKKISEVVFDHLVNLKVVSITDKKTTYNNARIGAVINSH